MKPLLTLVMACALALSACASGPTVDPAVQTANTLGQYDWQLSQASDQDGHYIHALFARPDKPLTVGFQNGRVHVANACNLLNGMFSIHEDKLEVKQMASTMMACMDPAVSALDHAIGDRLEHVSEFQLETDVAPPTLTLETSDGDTLVFQGVPRSK